MKKRNSIMDLVVLLIIILSIFLAGCITTEDSNTGQKLYTIDIPSEWITINPTNNYDTIYSPDQTNSIYFYITKPQTLDIGKSIGTIANDIIEREENKLTSFTLISSKNIDVKTLSAYEIIYTYKENNIDIKVKHAPMKDKDIVYELIYKAPINKYDQYISDINQAIYSFRTL